MTDQELLEYAAKAVWGYSPIKVTERGVQIGLYSWWNPLVSDADAFRLAVKLTLSVYPPCDGDPTAVVKDWRWGINITEVDEDRDYLATTRRAIVRAAAEIGRSIEDD